MKNEKNSVMELTRFIAAVIIMTHHSFVVCKVPDLYPTLNGWIYVEFFLVLTGFLTARHFDTCEFSNESKYKVAVEYTIKKFLPMMPYILFFTIAIWLLEGICIGIREGWTWNVFIAYYCGDFISDIFMISGSYSSPKLAPLWYIYAMVLVFPFFSVMLQRKDRYQIMTICLLFPLIFYGFKGIDGYVGMPFSLLRVLSGMMLGAFGYEIVMIFKIYLTRANRIVLSVIEFMTGLIPMWICVRNLVFYGYTTNRTVLLCFVIYIMLALSGFTITSNMSCRLFDYLGKLSVLIYIDHYFVAKCLNFVYAEEKLGGG